MTDRSSRLRVTIAALAVVALACVILGVVALTRGDDAASPGGECPEPNESTTSISDECAEALFEQAVAHDPQDEVADLSRTERLELARELCDMAEEINASSGPRPVRSELIATAAARWSLSNAGVEDIASAAEPICPEAFITLESLPVTNGPVRIELDVGGTGAVSVSYTNSDGSAAEESTFAPWRLPTVLQKPVDVELKVTPRDGNEDGRLTCTVRVGDAVLAEAKQDEGGVATCRVSAGELTAAANTR